MVGVGPRTIDSVVGGSGGRLIVIEFPERQNGDS